jgi:hypothetical protein
VAMKLSEAADTMQSLFDAPSPAVITLYDADGEAVVSPVWFRINEAAFEAVMAIGDRKLAHLQRDPRCVLLIFETVPPFRGVEVRGRAKLTPDTARRPPGVVVSLPIADARTWDLRRSLP